MRINLIHLGNRDPIFIRKIRDSAQLDSERWRLICRGNWPGGWSAYKSKKSQLIDVQDLRGPWALFCLLARRLIGFDQLSIYPFALCIVLNRWAAQLLDQDFRRSRQSLRQEDQCVRSLSTTELEDDQWDPLHTLTSWPSLLALPYCSEGAFQFLLCAPYLLAQSHCWSPWLHRAPNDG